MGETISVSSLYFMLAALLLFPVGYWALLPTRFPRLLQAAVIVGGMVVFAALTWLLARWWAGQLRPVLPTLAGILVAGLMLPLIYRLFPGRALAAGAPSLPRPTFAELHDLLVPLLLYALTAWSLTALLALWTDLDLDARLVWFALLMASAACAPTLPRPRPFQHGLFMLIGLEWLYAAGCWALVASWATLTPESVSGPLIGVMLLAGAASWLLWFLLVERATVVGRPATAVLAAALSAAARGSLAWILGLPAAIAGLLRRLVRALAAAAGAVALAILRLPAALAKGTRQVIQGIWWSLATLGRGLAGLPRLPERLVRAAAETGLALLVVAARWPGLAVAHGAHGARAAGVAVTRAAGAIWAGVRRAAFASAWLATCLGRGSVMLAQALGRLMRALAASLAGLLAALSRGARRLPGAAARAVRGMVEALAKGLAVLSRSVVAAGIAVARGMVAMALALARGLIASVTAVGRGLVAVPAALVRGLIAALTALAHGLVALPGLAWHALLALGSATAAAGRTVWAFLNWLSRLPAYARGMLRRLLAAFAGVILIIRRTLAGLPPRLGHGARLIAQGLALVLTVFGAMIWATVRWSVGAGVLLAVGLGRAVYRAARAVSWLGISMWQRLQRAVPRLLAGLLQAAAALPPLLWRLLLGLGRGFVAVVTAMVTVVWTLLRWLAGLPGAIWRLLTGAAAVFMRLVALVFRLLVALPSWLWRAARGLGLALFAAVFALGGAAWALIRWLAGLPGAVWRLLTGIATASARLMARLQRGLQQLRTTVTDASLRQDARRAWTVRPAYVLAIAALPVLLGLGYMFADNNCSRQERIGGIAGEITNRLCPRRQFSILAGSGFASFEPIIKRWGQQNGVDVQISYKGSLDIMLMLEKGSIKADAIWEGDSLWTSLGDKQKVVRNSQSIMCSPIVLGVKRSLAHELGWAGQDVNMQQILDAAESRRLRVLMTSATQSNSGASSYFGFLYAFAGNPEILTAEHLLDTTVQAGVKRILGTVDRTSDSSGWMRDLFLSRYDRYDAMFNYESHVLEMNQELVARGDEPLYIIYPLEGLGIADFPFSFVRNPQTGNAEREPLFRELQAYLLSDEVQLEIAAKGRRTGRLCDQVDPDVFRQEWGADAQRVLNSFKFPSEPVIRQALALYQTEFRKPSLTVFALDYSGSMKGEGKEALTKAMRTLLDQQTAAGYLLQASPDDLMAVVIFDDTLMNDPEDGWIVRGNDPAALRELMGKIEQQPVGHFTDIYLPVKRALEVIRAQGTQNAFPSVILMTDGQSNRGTLDEVRQTIAATGLEDVPVYGITFGDADVNQLNGLAELTAGRVFDGRKDLIGAFRKAKGQN